MTVKELRTLVDNLDEYIRIPHGIQRLRKTVLHLAISGQLTNANGAESIGNGIASTASSGDHDVPFRIPASWKWMKLGTAVTSINTGPFGSMLHKHDYVEGGIPIINPKHIKDSSVKPDTRVSLNPSRQSDFERYMLLPNDVIVARRGEVGRAALVRISDGRLMCGTGCFFIKVGNLDPAYLVKIFESDYAKKSLSGEAVGTTMVNLNQGILQELLVPVPPPDEQRKIVERLTQIDIAIYDLEKKYQSEEITRTQLAKATLQKLGSDGDSTALDYLTDIIKNKKDVDYLESSILSLALRGQLVRQMKDDGSGSDLLKEIQAQRDTWFRKREIRSQKKIQDINLMEVPYKIPESWVWVRLGTLCWLDQGIKTSNQTYNVLDAKYLRGKKAADIKDSGFLIRQGERAILVDGENSGEVFNVPETGYLGSTFKVLRTTDLINDEYLKIILLSIKEEMRKNKIGAAIPHLDKNLFREKYVPLPPYNEQMRIGLKVTEIFSLTNKLLTKLIT